MKNNLYRKGFIVPVLIVIIALLVIGGGVYLYKNKKVEAPVVVNESENVGPDNSQEVVYVDEKIIGNKDDLISFSVKSGDVVSGILKLSGVIKNGYFFEGNIGIGLLDASKNLLKQGNGTATSNWMTIEPVSFTSTIDSTGLFGAGYIAIQEDDPSGGEGGPAKTILVPVIFNNTNQKTMSVKVYFGDTIDAQSCNTPSYVERVIPKTTAVARASIEELLKGPTEAEKLKDFWTGLRSGVSINSISINNGVASLDLSLSSTLSLNDANRGACGASIILKQIENTLKQFSTVKSVVITVNGKPAVNFIDP